MDTFFEQIVVIKKSAKNYALIIGIWLLAIILAYLALCFLSALFVFAVAIAGLIGYGAYRLTKMFFVEYEYIVTNGTLDIDKITAKSSRKRVMSFDIENVTSVEKYNPNQRTSQNNEKTVIACNIDDKNAYKLIANKEGKGTCVLVFAPNERIIEGVVKSLPKYLSNSAFK